MARMFVCKDCREAKAVDTATGPLPSTCDDCDPEAAQARAQRQARERTRYRERQAYVTGLERQVEQLTARLAGRCTVLDADRDTLAKAVRRVGFAEGRPATIVALRHLADVAESWAAILDDGTARVAEAA